MKTKQKRVSLLFELETIKNCLTVIRIMAAELGTDQFVNATDYRAAPACIEGISILMGERLRLLSSVVRDETDPRLLWCPDNAISPAIADDPEIDDIILTEWDSKRRRREAQAEFHRTRRHRTKRRRHKR